MKLIRIRIEQWRQFKAPFVVDDLQPGINVFAGPNECGKSTLVEAIQAAFFERHKSGTVTHFLPWSDSAAAPAVALTFNWQGQIWQLQKRFLGRARCELNIAGNKTNGDDAEDQLAQLLGYSLAGRGTSKAEHHGIPGLLWVQQGTLQDVAAPVQHAADHLQSALGHDLGAIASSSGDWLLGQVTELRSALLTKTGRATGEFKKTEQELADRSSELQTLDDKIARYEEKVDTLAQLQTDQRQIDATKPWEAQRSKAKKAQAQLHEAQKLIQAQEQAQRNLVHCQNQQKLLRDKLQSFEDDTRLLAERQKTRDQAQAAVDDLLAGRQPLQNQQSQAQKAHQAADETYQQARRAARRKHLQNEHGHLKTTLGRDQKTLATLQKLEAERLSLLQQRQQQAIEPNTLKALQQTQQQLNQLALRKEVAATRMSWHLDAGQTLNVAGQTVAQNGEQLLLQATDIDIPGVGKLQITPGGKDAGVLARQETHLLGDRATLLAELGVASVADAEARAAACQRMDVNIQTIHTRIQDLAPEGAAAFADRVKTAKAQLAALAEKISALPSAPADTPSEDDAERARNTTAAALSGADAALRQYHEQLGLARQAHQTAQSEWQRLHNVVHDPGRQQAQQDASRALTEQMAAEQTLAADIAQRQAQINAANPQLLEDDIQRLNASADASQQAANQRQRDLDRLQTELQTLGAQGLSDQRGELQQTVDALQRRHHQLAARARALELLLTLLQEQRQALTRRLQAPLQKHLSHYLKLLFPNAQIQVDDNLVPTLLQRAGQHGAFNDLSFGAREQLGLISRLAYADLLQEAGRPTLIILDDALVHADPQRLARMKRILYDAAKRHQVLLFTCHPANWSDVGTTARDLPTLKAQAS